MKRIVSAGLAWAVAAVLFMLTSARAGEAPPNLLENGDFEAVATQSGDQTAPGWHKLWLRDAGAGSATIDSAVHHGGKQSLRVEHHGQRDWAVDAAKNIPATPGQILQLRGWLKSENATRVELCLTTLDAKGKEINWALAAVESKGTHDWQEMARSCVVPDGCAAVRVRFIGNGPGTAWADDISLTRHGDLANIQAGLKAKSFSVENRFIAVRLDPMSGTLAVTDKRNNKTWEQKQIEPGVVVTGAEAADASLHLSLLSLADNMPLKADLTLVPDHAEIEFTLAGQGPMTQRLAYPQPFVTDDKAWIVLPMNEGIMYPAGDQSIKPNSLVCYSGHGLCMPWYGVTEADEDGAGHGGAGMMAIIQTPDDADVETTRQTGTPLFVRPRWEPTRGQFGYVRKLTWTFFDAGGYPAQAKRYRKYAQFTGLLKTLEQKEKQNPNVDLLIGAANVWNWDMDKVALCKEMKAIGMEHVLWSNDGKPAELAAINALGYLTSRYDIFQDVWPPGKPAWATHTGWPQDLVLLPDASPMKGWVHVQHNKDGTKTAYDGGVICSSRQIDEAKRRVPPELKTHPFGCRFIDTTTASPWRECYNPDHPLTRSDDRKYKMALLEYFAKDCKLVVGSETGIDPAVPYVSYFEGMMSLGPYRLPDAGRDVQAYKPPTPEFLKFQVGEYYRIPLWEMVYHDCVVADWYWGDYNNKAPEVWDRRDLFNILYSTPPVFMFDKKTWNRERDRFAQSYRNICPLVRRLGHAQMMSHEFLTPDHAVQQTVWSDETHIIVNFGATAYTLSPGHELGPMEFTVERPCTP